VSTANTKSLVKSSVIQSVNYMVLINKETSQGEDSFQEEYKCTEELRFIIS